MQHAKQGSQLVPLWIRHRADAYLDSALSYIA